MTGRSCGERTEALRVSEAMNGAWGRDCAGGAGGVVGMAREVRGAGSTLVVGEDGSLRLCCRRVAGVDGGVVMVAQRHPGRAALTMAAGGASGGVGSCGAMGVRG